MTTQNLPLGQVELVEFDRASEWVLNVLQLLKWGGIQRTTTLHRRVQSTLCSFNSNTNRHYVHTRFLKTKLTDFQELHLQVSRIIELKL